MAKVEHPKVGFIGWNPFQFLHFGSLISKFPGATLVIEERRAARKSINLESFAEMAVHTMHCNRRRMREIDGEFDVLVCQTPFAGIEEIRESRIAMLQYGYAKEAHNFGAWRSFADVCMTYGPYASRKIMPFAPCVATGNPRFEAWQNPELHRRALEKYSSILNSTKKTVLYAPTWGGLSSFHTFADAVAALSAEFNVLVKVHHLSVLFGNRSGAPLRQKFPHLCGAEHDLIELLSLADVLLSDFSGAIFDAIQAKVPVVLLGGTAAHNKSRSDRYSLEQARRDELGQIAATPGDVAASVRRALATGTSAPALASLRDDLFTDPAGASERAARTIHELAAGAFVRSQSQEYMRHEMAALHRLRARPSIGQSLRRLFGKRSESV
jgi:hypothetical protein